MEISGIMNLRECSYITVMVNDRIPIIYNVKQMELSRSTGTK